MPGQSSTTPAATQPQHILDLDKVARIHAEALGAKLTPLSDEQAEYLDVTPSGPFKPETYRY